jgi:hypothetical protein
MNRNELLDMLLELPVEQRFQELAGLKESQKEEFATHWRLWARKDQLPPEGDWTSGRFSPGAVSARPTPVRSRSAA